jgi:DNA-binding NtrC family response regulator
VTDDWEIAVFPGSTVLTRALHGELVVGRQETCQLCVDDGSMSRRHAMVKRVGDAVHVKDLESANGTFVRERDARDRNATWQLRRLQSTTVPLGAVVYFGAVLGVIRRTEAAPSIVVSDLGMRAVHERLARAAGSSISVLLRGETGVGKEVLAREVHARSPRAAQRFLAINCGAIAPTLVESELFGHEKGAFTGALSAQVGLFESANGGTVFLDEVGELPLDVQAKLLRVLEERAVMPVGGRAARPIDVRIVSATHRDLEADCRAGRFRQDLFFRLEGMALKVPPLRERPTEVLELARLFLARASESAGRAAAPTLAASTVSVLERYTWPGNVRELKNAIELAAVLSSGDEVLPSHLPERLVRASFRPPAGPDAERARVLAALDSCDGNQTRAAEMLGISRRTLVSRLTDYGLTNPRKP